MKQFDVPGFYRSPLIATIKQVRKQADKLKKDLSPTLLDAGPVQFYLARHFGFCYGVENAIEIAYRCLQENKGKRIFLLSEMIHNPQVNADLQAQGIQFLQDTYGKPLVPFDSLLPTDIVIIPAFGTTLAMQAQLVAKGISPERYNTTCPFVEKVWNRGEALGEKGFSLVIHGKPAHEETRATFSRTAAHSPAVVVADMAEAQQLAQFITGQLPAADFYSAFAGRFSEGFDIQKDLQRFGVINQTTQLATDTQAIADYLRQVVKQHNALTENEVSEKFADNRDTLCYATNDNQTAVRAMLDTPAHLALVIGGYNSSNTSHLVELCEGSLPTYYIDSAECLQNKMNIDHFNWRTKKHVHTQNYLPDAAPLRILITSGASCPDATVEAVLQKLLSFFSEAKSIENLFEEMESTTAVT